MTERVLSPTEADFLAAVTAVPWPRAAALRESIPYLVVTGGCDCGCASFDVRDTRHSKQAHTLEHWCNAVSADGVAGAAVYLGPAGRLLTVDVVPPAVALPEVAGLQVRPPGQ